MDEPTIRKQIRDRLKAGHLKRDLPPATLLKGGAAPNAVTVVSMLKESCAACDGPGTQIKYNYPTGSVAFHTRCNQIWEEERQKQPA